MARARDAHRPRERVFVRRRRARRAARSAARTTRTSTGAGATRRSRRSKRSSPRSKAPRPRARPRAAWRRSAARSSRSASRATTSSRRARCTARARASSASGSRGSASTTTFVDDPTPEAYARGDHARDACTLHRDRRATRRSRSPTSPASSRSARARGVVTIADNTFATPFCQTPARARRRPRRALDDEGARRPRRRHRRRRRAAARARRARARHDREGLRRRASRRSPRSSSRAACAPSRCGSARVRDRGAPRARARGAPGGRARASPVARSHPGHALARSRCTRSVRSCRSSCDGGDALDAGARVLEGVDAHHARGEPRRRALARHAPGVDDALDACPPTHAPRASIGDGLLRLSVGLESADDLERDLLAALESALRCPFRWARGRFERASPTGRVRADGARPWIGSSSSARGSTT